MVQVLLINPPYAGNVLPGQTWHPIGILTLGSYLKSFGYSVSLIDGVVDREMVSKIEKMMENPELKLLGISLMTSQIRYALPIAKMVREKRSDIALLWGGIHPSLFPEQTINHPLVDICVMGEGEKTLNEIVELTYDSNGKDKNSELSKVDGIFFKKEGIIQKTGTRELIDLDDLPFLEYELLGLDSYINQDYRLYGSTKKRALAVNSARGCPYRCTFCINSVIGKRQYRAKSVGRLLDEIDHIVEKYAVDHIDFIDEEFFAIKKRTYEFIEGLEKRDYKLTWSAGTRANYFDPEKGYFTEEFVKRLYKAGCIRWAIGVESGSEKMLEALKKDITREQVLISAKICKEAGMNTLYTFMIGMPYETRIDIIDSLLFAKKLFSIYPDNSYMVGPTIFRP
ncbi:B12-binding domain-containing radical SAM protein, partial [bacterium]|nr:B12-binding domain-containing radical SAM protein [bacterium]